jgi:hypothetical protein
MQLCDIDGELNASSVYASKADCRSDSKRWQKFYTNYLDPTERSGAPGNPGNPSVAKVKFPKRSFGDGGYLDNAPFSYSVDALLSRQSIYPVDRKLIYVEPSPGHPEEERLMAEKPNAIQNSLDALLFIPRYETIRDDLRRVLDRNRATTRIRKTLTQVEGEVEHEATSGDGGRPKKLTSDVISNEITFLKNELCLQVYYRLRAGSVTDQLAQVVANLLCIDPDSVWFVALRSLVREWRESRYEIDRLQASMRWPHRPVVTKAIHRPALSLISFETSTCRIGFAGFDLFFGRLTTYKVLTRIRENRRTRSR